MRCDVGRRNCDARGFLDTGHFSRSSLCAEGAGCAAEARRKKEVKWTTGRSINVADLRDRAMPSHSDAAAPSSADLDRAKIRN
jgi:hypothetical protein